MTQGTVSLKRSGAKVSEGVFKAASILSAVALLTILALMIFKLIQLAAPAIASEGADLAIGRRWAPSESRFGALPMIYGTLVTSLIALVLALPIAVATSLFITEIAPPRLRAWLSSTVDLLAAVPSVVYGLWGILVLVPAIRPIQVWLADTFGGSIPLFAPPAPGVSYLTAALVLAIMILPTISAVSREVLLTVPRSLREASLALGATRWEMIRMAVLPSARDGIIGGAILGLGRALGETIAVTIVIGNSPDIRASLLAPGYTMASVIANEFAEATGALHIEALIAIALMLFIVTLAVNMVARILVRSTKRKVARV